MVALAFFWADMKLNVYVDAFNLYYGSLFGTAYKWLNLLDFAQATFPGHQINRIRYLTARVRARPHDPDQPTRQETYFRALRTLPNLTIHQGHYLEKPVRMALFPVPTSGARIVQVLKSEEKGSDVNIATYLLMDAFENDYEGAVVVSNDSDLAEPIRLVRTKLRRRVFVLHPCSRGSRSPSIELRKAVGLRSGVPALVVNPVLLAAHQFAPTLTDATGAFHKPTRW
jgi:uncharacterized LabA/DUF88 family protein